MPLEIAVLLLPRFSLMALASVLEPFRIANRLAERELYRWRFVSPEAGPIEASSGLPITAELSVRDPDHRPARDRLHQLRAHGRRRPRRAALAAPPGRHGCRALGRRHRRLPAGRGRAARRPHRHPALGEHRRLRRAVRQGRDPPLPVRALRPRRHLRRRHRRHRPGAHRHRRRARLQPRPRRRRPADPPGHPRRRRPAAGGADAPLRHPQPHRPRRHRPPPALDRAAAVAGRRRRPHSPSHRASSSGCSPPTSAARSSASTASCGWSERGSCWSRPACRCWPWRSPRASARWSISAGAIGPMFGTSPRRTSPDIGMRATSAPIRLRTKRSFGSCPRWRSWLSFQ